MTQRLHRNRYRSGTTVKSKFSASSILLQLSASHFTSLSASDEPHTSVRSQSPSLIGAAVNKYYDSSHYHLRFNSLRLFLLQFPHCCCYENHVGEGVHVCSRRNTKMLSEMYVMSLQKQ
ncbi:unnamed protein product [Vicia faba]|uniref:Uncharacterized protein n=1 Tax=Vicia faba TaxID=3906 RepID=A0AAV1AW56_VICFA|nr:unnamed protein product [Vicia faba]